MPRLQLQPAYSITQPLLFLPQLANLQLLQTAQPTSASSALSRRGSRALPGATLRWIRQSPLLQLRLGDKRLLAAGHSVQLRFDAGEEGVELGFEGGEEGLLGGLEGGFGDEFEVLWMTLSVLVGKFRQGKWQRTRVVCSTLLKRG